MKRISLNLAVFAIFLFAQAAQADWTPAKRLTWNSGASTWPEIAVDSSGNVHVVWQDDTPTPGKCEIYYRKSTDGGSTWTPSQRITWTSGLSITPAVAVDSSGNLHVVWVDNTPPNAELYYAKSTNAGSTWTAPKRITWTSGTSYRPAIAVNSIGAVHIVWEDDTPTPGIPEVYYKKSTDKGSTWAASHRLSWNSGSSVLPAVAVDSSGNVHIVWEDDTPTPGIPEVYYRKSTDGGSTWTAGHRLTWNSGSSGHPDIAVESSSNLHVVWHDTTPGNYEIYYRKSTDGGSAWMPGRRLTWNIGWSANAAIAVDSFGNVHVVWDDETPGNHEIGYKRSPDGGSAWTASQNITGNSGSSANPAVAVDSSGNVHVVWDDDTPVNAEIYYREYVK